MSEPLAAVGQRIGLDWLEPAGNPQARRWSSGGFWGFRFGGAFVESTAAVRGTSTINWGGSGRG